MRPHDLPPHDGGGSARATHNGENPEPEQRTAEDWYQRADRDFDRDR